VGRAYEETHTAQWRVDVPVDVVWDYIQDAGAQVRHDPRITDIDLVSGEWSAEGSEMTISGFGVDGKQYTIQVRLLGIERMRYYRTQEVTPDVTVTNTISTEPHESGTVVTTVTQIRTRDVNWLERAVVRATRRKRRAGFEFAAGTAQRAVEDYYTAGGRPLSGGGEPH
jgi:hypothetical protein